MARVGEVISEAERAKFIDWIKERGGGNTSCQSCAGTKFSVSSELAEVACNHVTISAPMVMVSCDNCGLVNFYSAVISGIVPKG